MPTTNLPLGEMLNYFSLGVLVCSLIWAAYEEVKFLVRKIIARKR